MAIGALKLLLNFDALVTSAAEVSRFALIFSFVVTAFLIIKTSAGRNWARVTLLVFLLIGALPTVGIVLAELSQSVFAGLLTVAQVGLQAYALYLVFTKPGNSWFRKGARLAAPSPADIKQDRL